MDKRARIWAFGVRALGNADRPARCSTGETLIDTLAAVLTATIDWSALPAVDAAARSSTLLAALSRARSEEAAARHRRRGLDNSTWRHRLPSVRLVNCPALVALGTGDGGRTRGRSRDRAERSWRRRRAPGAGSPVHLPG